MTNHFISSFFVYCLFSYFFAAPIYSQQINTQNSIVNNNSSSIPNCGTISPPFIETFSNSFFYDSNDPKSLDSCWFQTDFNITDSLTSYSSSNFVEHKEWYKNGFANVTDSGAITLRVDDNTPNSLMLITPSIDMGSLTDTFHLEFDLSYTDTAANVISSFGSNFGCTQTFQVLFSEDDGATWSVAWGWEDLKFDLNNIPDFPSEHYTMMLRNSSNFAVFSGNIRLAFHFYQIPGFFPCDEVFDIHLDNFEISDDIVYVDFADIEPSLIPATSPLFVNESYYRAVDQLCLGIDTTAVVNYAIFNNGPYNSTLAEITVIGNEDTVFSLQQGPIVNGSGFQFFQDVGELCPGIFDSASTCDVIIHMTSLNPGDNVPSNDTIIFQIVSNDQPSFLNVNADTSICPGTSIQLNGQSDATVTWKDGFGNTYSDGDIVSPTVTTTYFATAGVQNCDLTNQFNITIVNETLDITHNAGVLTGTSGFDTYSWEFGGVIISTSETATLNGFGIYTLTTTMNGCEYKEEYNHESIGLADFDKLPIAIYPNPFNDKITIPIQFECADVYNTTGQKVFTTESANVDLSKLVSGFYTIIIYTADNTYEQKLLKM